jgi:formate/nitrite transporter FocA (FNT family)
MAHRSKQQRSVLLLLDRDKFALFLASALATLVMGLSFYFGKVDYVTVAKRVALTVFIVYPVTFLVVWRIVGVAGAELSGNPAASPDGPPKDDTNAGEGG